MIITLKGANFSGTGNNIGNLSQIGGTFTFTINPTPSDATVKINGTARKSITGAYGTAISWEVSKDGYNTRTGSTTMPLGGKTMNVTLTAVGSGDTGGDTGGDTPMYTYTVNVTPKVANVTLSALGYNQSGNSITVADGTPVSWSVESLGYTTQSGTETITSNKSSDIELTSADETQPVLTVYSTPSGKTLWTPSGGTAISKNETGSFVGSKIGMRCYWGVTKDGYEPQGDVAILNSNINKEVTLNAVPIVEVERVLELDTDMIRKTGYFIASGGAWNGYYANFCFHQIPVQPGQSYRITTSTGQNAYPALFCTSTLDLNSIDTTGQPAGNTLTKYTVKSSKRYGGPPALGTYVVTVPEDTTCMLVNSGTATAALNAFKVELLK